MTPTTPAALPCATLNEGLCKQLIKEYYRRIHNGEKPRVVLHALLHSTYAHGHAAGKRAA